MDSNVIDSVAKARRVVFLCGAGLSVPSGIRAYRSGPNAIWGEHVLEWGTREKFLAGPAEWWTRFWLEAHGDLFKKFEPNAAPRSNGFAASPMRSASSACPTASCNSTAVAAGSSRSGGRRLGLSNHGGTGDQGKQSQFEFHVISLNIGLEDLYTLIQNGYRVLPQRRTLANGLLAVQIFSGVFP